MAVNKFQNMISENYGTLGFKDTSIGKMGIFSRGKGIKNENLKNKGFPCITYGQLYTKYGETIGEINTFIDEEIGKTSVLIEKGDILFTASGETQEEIGKASVFLCDFLCYAGGDIHILRPNKNYDSTYLAYLFNSHLYHEQRLKLGQGYSVVHIQSEHLGKIILPVPDMQIQVKITHILSAWNKAIDKHQSIINKLQIFKTSARDTLFASNFEFPKYPLRDLLKKSTHFSGEDISEKYLEIGDIDISTNTYSLKDKKPVSGAKSANRGTILVSTVRPTRGAIVILDENLKVSSALTQINIDENKASPYFVYAQLLTKKFLNQMGSLSSGSTYPTVSHDDVLSYKVVIPPKEIQEKQTLFLRAIDSAIKLREDMVNKLIAQKQGLMQQLLTGKIRVKVD